MMNNKAVYRYMDINIKKKRDDALKDFFENKEYKNELDFLDLDIFKKKLSLSDKIKNIMFKSTLEPNITLTKYQIEILNILMENNIFLSAPTSFGKTFIMLEYINRNKNLNNIVFIVPTLALMNELLKKIYNYFGNSYNICINGDESIEKRNIFVFVPERSDSNFIKKVKEMSIDLLIFDEIYKLQQESKNNDRLIYMNKVYLDLVTKAKKIALLGPYIKNVSFQQTNLDIVKYFTNYMPVYNQIKIIDNSGSWIDNVKMNSELVYFKSPGSIYKNIDIILDNIPEDEYYIEMYSDEIEYLENLNGESWYVISLLKRGIGIHHGKTPMFLRKFYEYEYNQKNIKILLCTSTLMEGINTPTLVLHVVDDPGSSFKYNNLIGRVGRLKTSDPVLGNIYIARDNALKYLNNTDDWLDLTILAEDSKVYSDDEILYLNKRYDDSKKQKNYEDKITKLKTSFDIAEEDLIANNLKFEIISKFINEKYYFRYKSATKLIDCVKITNDLFSSRKKGYAFKVDKFKDLETTKNYLPYNFYIIKLLTERNFSSLINRFNEEYNKQGNIENINIFIDALYELNNYIKFVFSEIVGYMDVFKMKDLNEHTQKLYGLVSSYNESNIVYKILDDLGIETNDLKLLTDELNLDNNTSVSKVIYTIRSRKEELLKKNINPFSKKNIISM